MSTSKASVNLFTFPTRRASESNESHLRNYPPNEDIFPLNYPRSCNIVRCNSQNKYSWSQLFEGSSGICSSCFFIVPGPEHEPCAPAGRLGLQSSVTTSSPARFWRSLLSEKSEGQPRGNGVGVSRRASREPGWAGSPNLQGVPLPCPAPTPSATCRGPAPKIKVFSPFLQEYLDLSQPLEPYSPCYPDPR